jgi:hypothetical protein
MLSNLDKSPHFSDAHNTFITSKIKGEAMSKAPRMTTGDGGTLSQSLELTLR